MHPQQHSLRCSNLFTILAIKSSLAYTDRVGQSKQPFRQLLRFSIRLTHHRLDCPKSRRLSVFPYNNPAKRPALDVILWHLAVSFLCCELRKKLASDECSLASQIKPLDYLFVLRCDTSGHRAEQKAKNQRFGTGCPGIGLRTSSSS